MRSRSPQRYRLKNDGTFVADLGAPGGVAQIDQWVDMPWDPLNRDVPPKTMSRKLSHPFAQFVHCTHVLFEAERDDVMVVACSRCGLWMKAHWSKALASPCLDQWYSGHYKRVWDNLCNGFYPRPGGTWGPDRRFSEPGPDCRDRVVPQHVLEQRDPDRA